MKCVAKGNLCQDPAVGTSAENLSSKANQATVTDLSPDTEYTCCILVRTNEGLEAYQAIDIKTKEIQYVTRAYIRPISLRRGSVQDQDTQVCTLNSEGGLADCVSAQLRGFRPVATVRSAILGGTHEWITFLDQTSMRNMMYTCPLNPDGTIVYKSCKNVHKAGGYILYNFFNSQSTKAWMLYRSPERTDKVGTVCDIDAAGNYQNCQDIIPEAQIDIKGIPIASPGGRSVYVPSVDGILYCNETASKCDTVKISPSFDLFNEDYVGANIGFHSSNVALIAFDFVLPAANDKNTVNETRTLLLRCELESPTTFMCEEYGYPSFTTPTAIFGFEFANNGTNVYLLTVFNEGQEAAVEYCAVGTRGLVDCERVLKFSDQDILALTHPILV